MSRARIPIKVLGKGQKGLLGHSDMAMVKRYARVAQTDRSASLWDCARAHQKASLVDNWRL